MSKTENVFGQFKPAERTIKVKALGDKEVTIKNLTVAESNQITGVLTKDAEIDLKTGGFRSLPVPFQNSKLLAISLAMVDPKMSVEELEALSQTADDALTEIYEAIRDGEKDEDEVKKK